MKQLLSAVSYCHKQQIIHRNIRPESILLASEEGWNIKLAGFVYAVKRPELFSNDDEPLQN
jgi:serine/threonine protein kinase